MELRAVRVQPAGGGPGLERGAAGRSRCSRASWCSRTTRWTRRCGERGREVADVHSARSVEQTNYPLTVVAAPGRGIVTRVSYDRDALRGNDRADAGAPADAAGGNRRDPKQRLAELPLLTEAERHQLLVRVERHQGRFPQRHVHPRTVPAAGRAHARCHRRRLRRPAADLCRT